MLASSGCGTDGTIAAFIVTASITSSTSSAAALPGELICPADPTWIPKPARTSERLQEDGALADVSALLCRLPDWVIVNMSPLGTEPQSPPIDVRSTSPDIRIT